MKHLTRYIIGFSLSLITTIAAALLTWIHIQNEHGMISHEILIPVIFGLATVQATMQLIFFLQLGSEKPRQQWQFAAFVSTAGLMLIIVAATFWIMNHLNYNMTPDQINNYLQDQSGEF